MYTASTSATHVPNGPIWSRELPIAISPYRDVFPYVGLSPTTPQNAAGWRIDPPVSDPRATGTPPYATTAAEPPDDPPATRVVSAGFFVTPYAEFSVEPPIANSSMFARPSRMAPASFNFFTTVAS